MAITTPTRSMTLPYSINMALILISSMAVFITSNIALLYTGDDDDDDEC